MKPHMQKLTKYKKHLSFRKAFCNDVNYETFVRYYWTLKLPPKPLTFSFIVRKTLVCKFGKIYWMDKALLIPSLL